MAHAHSFHNRMVIAGDARFWIQDGSAMTAYRRRYLLAAVESQRVPLTPYRSSGTHGPRLSSRVASGRLVECRYSHRRPLGDNPAARIVSSRRRMRRPVIECRTSYTDCAGA